MNALRPGEGLRPDAAGPLFLALARSTPFLASAPNCYPFRGSRSWARRVPKPMTVTANLGDTASAARGTLRAGSHWTERCPPWSRWRRHCAVHARRRSAAHGFRRRRRLERSSPTGSTTASGILAGVTCLLRGLAEAAEQRGVWIAAGIFAWTLGDIYYTVCAAEPRRRSPSRRSPMPAISVSTFPCSSASACSCAPRSSISTASSGWTG